MAKKWLRSSITPGDPYCEADEIKGRPWIIAAQDIQVGEELTADYNPYDGDLDDPRQPSCEILLSRKYELSRAIVAQACSGIWMLQQKAASIPFAVVQSLGADFTDLAYPACAIPSSRQG